MIENMRLDRLKDKHRAYLKCKDKIRPSFVEASRMGHRKKAIPVKEKKNLLQSKEVRNTTSSNGNL